MSLSPEVVAKQHPLLVRVVKMVAAAIVGGVLGGLGALFHDEIHAYFSYLFVGGNLRGEYVLQGFDYDGPTKQWAARDTKVILKHGGSKVFGTESSAINTWNLFGYFRDPILSLAYENNDPGAVGTGTYTLTRDLPFVLWGHWIGVECDDNTHAKFLAQCPAVLYRADHAAAAEQYTEFMKRDCVRITLSSGPCPIRKLTPTKKTGK
jgi:hypothetical protein